MLLLSDWHAQAGGVVTAEIVSAPTSVCPGSLSSVQVRIRFDGDDNDGPWQVLTIALRDDDIFPAYNTIRSASNPFTISSQGVWYSYTFSNVDLSAYNDGGDGVELYVWAEVDDNDVNFYQPDGRSTIRRVNVGSAPTAPSGPSPASGSTVTTQPTILNWADSSGATSYDVYLDGTFRANVTVSQWTLNQTLILGTHNWYVVAKNSCGSITSLTWSFTISCPMPGTPSSPAPANGASLSSQPTILDWADTSGATSYDVYLDGTFRANVPVSQWTLNQTLSLSTHNWYVVAKNGCGPTTGPTWSFTISCPLPGFPSSPNPANGATINTPPTVLNWSDTSGATSYDVYLDGTFRANVPVSQWTVNQTLTIGSHNWSIVAKNSCGSSPGPSPVWSFTISCPTLGTPSSPNPANGSTVSSQPTILDWADSSGATSYDVYMDGSFRGNVTASQWTLNLTIFPGLHSWYAVAKNGCDSTTGPTWSFTLGSPPGTPSSPSPADGAALTVDPIKLDWANTSGATSYDVYLKLGSGAFNKVGADLPVSEWVLNQSYDENLFSWYVVAKNAVGSTRGPTWSYNISIRVSRIFGEAPRSGHPPTPVFIQRYPTGTTALIDPSLRTWIIIHGRENSSTEPWVLALAAEVADMYSNDQILLVDWSSAAMIYPTPIDPFELSTDEEDWIEPVASWVAGKLVDYGFAGSDINLLGHSWGGNMCAEVAELIPYNRGHLVNLVNTIVAIDPADNGTGSYNPEDLNDNGEREVDFARNSRFSWAFHSSDWGSGRTPLTAHEAFGVFTDGTQTERHSKVIEIFIHMLRNLNAVSQRFSLARLLDISTTRSLGPWRPDAYEIKLSWETITVSGYEGAIFADIPGGHVPQTLVYISDSTGLVVSESVAGTAPEITVLRGDVVITDGSTSTSNGGGTDFGTVAQGQTAPERVFTIANYGGSPLNLGLVDVPTGYTLTEPLATTLRVGESDTFTIRLDTAFAGTKSGQISFSNNDSDENPFNFSIIGNVTAPPTVSTPTISPSGGNFAGSVQVTMACSTPQALIYYTTDGSEPTPSSTSYEGPFTLSSSVTVKSKAFRSGYNPSATAIANFTITPTPARIISLSGDLAFGVVTVGASAQRTLTIANNGNSILTVSSISYNPTVFSGNWAGTIAAGDSQNVSVTFSPTSETSYSGTVTVNSDKTAGINSWAVSGTGTIVPLQYTITASAGSGGGISPSGSITKNAGDDQAFTANPDVNNVVDQWLLDGGVVQSGGTGYTLPNIQADRSVQVTFTFAPTEYTYTINNGAITITGYTGSGGAVTIPSTMNGMPVIRIGDSAFQKNTTLTSVTIPDSVTSIGDSAFYECASLASITIPSSVTSIRYQTFDGCTSLTSITIPDSVTNIGAFAFSYCTRLASITIPSSVTSIGYQTFGGCTSLTSITIPSSVISIPGYAFSYCSRLTSITIPSNVTSIGERAFYACSGLTVVTIPNSVTSIGEETFGGCTSLTSITIPSSVTYIGEAVFYRCTRLASITIPSSVTSIGGRTFSDCTSLNSVTIPDSVTSIGNLAFTRCTSLNSIMIPSSVTSIGERAFYYCTSLSAIYFQGNVPSVGSQVFEGDDNVTIYYLSGTTGWGPTFGGRPTAIWNPLPESPRQLTALSMSNGVTRFVLNGPVGINYLVQFSSNLVNWLPLSTHTISTSGSILIIDPSIGNQSRRFYRAAQGPADMAWISPGTFTMGSPAIEANRYSYEGPQTEVTITQGFWMGRHEVTQGEFQAVTGRSPSYFGGHLNYPVEQVSWEDAAAYCVALTTLERNAGRLPADYSYRLPTEAEWEYACRADTGTAFHYGSEMRSGMANFDARSEYESSVGTNYNAAGIHLDRTTTVGSYAPNAWGLHDLHGNVWEWCSDWWSSSLPGGSVTNPPGPTTGTSRVRRGGSFDYPGYRCRSADRYFQAPGAICSCTGFRVVLAPVRP